MTKIIRKIGYNFILYRKNVGVQRKKKVNITKNYNLNCAKLCMTK